MGVFAGGSTVLTPDRSRELVRTENLGRLIIVLEDEVEVYPVNYALTDSGSVVFRTAPGSKLAGLTVSPRVTFEVDRVEGDTAWSVVLRGRARMHKESSALTFADSLDVHPWVSGDKFEVVEVTVDAISGRAFHRTERAE